MAKLIYSAIPSLDGYVEDAEGKFDWAALGDEVFAFVNEFERPIGTYLYGRRMYETMVFWETVSTADQRAVFRDFAAIWRAAEKIVYSRTLQAVSTRGHESSAISMSTRSGGSRRSQDPTSRSVVPSLPGRQSGRNWSTSAIYSSRRSWSVPASQHCPRMSAGRSSSWASPLR
jgi:hypothetical protein